MKVNSLTQFACLRAGVLFTLLVVAGSVTPWMAASARATPSVDSADTGQRPISDQFNKTSATGSTGWRPMGGVKTGCNGPVYALARLSDGRVVLGGRFSVCGGVRVNSLATWDGTRYGALGAPGLTFSTGNEGFVYSIAVVGQAVYVGGLFDRAGSVAAAGVARLQSGTWSALGSGLARAGTRPTVRALEPVGTALWVGGQFDQAGGASANSLAVWSGTTWSATAAGGVTRTDGSAGTVNALHWNGSRMLVGGNFEQAGAVAADSIAVWQSGTWSALGATGASGSAFGGAIRTIEELAGRVYVGGDFQTAPGPTGSTFRAAFWDGAQWQAMGARPSSNGLAGLAPFAAAMREVNGQLVVAGNFNAAVNCPDAACVVSSWGVIRYGSNWQAAYRVGLGAGAGTYYSGEAILPDAAASDAYLVAGDFGAADTSVGASNLARWTGSVWQSLADLGPQLGANGSITAAAVGGGQLYVGGQFSEIGGVPAFGIARFDGQRWHALGAGRENGLRIINNTFGNRTSVSAIAIDGANVYVAGFFTHGGSVESPGLLRWDGQAWRSMGTGASSNSIPRVNALALYGGSLYVGGSFTQFGGVGANHLARRNGTSWAAVGGANNGTNGPVHALVADSSALYVGGAFSQAGGVAAGRLARFNGSFSNMGGGVSLAGGLAEVTALALDRGALYVGGNFTLAGSVSARNVARWNDGNWSGLGSGVTSSQALGARISGILADPSGVYVVGNFDSAGGQPAANLARWSGSAWDSFGGGIASFRTNTDRSVVSAVARAANGQLVFVGAFDEVDGQLSSSIVMAESPSGLFADGFEAR
jgi:hypothetical protein